MAAGIPTVTAAPEIERRTISKVSWRLLPLIVVIYFVAYMDRTNVGFASFGLNREFGFSATLYGWGAGIFFLGYFFFEVPSNVLLERTGARIWIARIIAGPISFLVMRFLLGVAEAGFFPGMILYFTYWFPRKYRARVVAALFLAVPGSNALTAVISGALLQLDGVLGFHGWQWLFMVEAVPAIILAFVVLALMTDRPAKATWLAEDERRWLEDTLEAERRSTVKAHGHFTLRQALTDSRVLTLAGIYFTIVTATYGITFFLPPILKSLKLTDWETGLATAVPYVIGTIGMVSWSWSSDRRNERRWHFVIAAIVAAIGLIAAGPLLGSLWALVAPVRGPAPRDHADRADVGGHRGTLRHQAGLLAPAGGVPVGTGRGRRHRADQFDRQSRRLRRPLRPGLAEGRHRHLRGRPVLPGGLRPGLRGPRLRDDPRAVCRPRHGPRGPTRPPERVTPERSR
jgi:ACS family tartrate transporter-like MFS transporter